MWRVSSSEMTSLHSVLNFFLPSLIEACECGNLIKTNKEWVVESCYLHWFYGETVAFVYIFAEVIDHVLEFWLSLLPRLSIYLLVGRPRWLLWLLLLFLFDSTRIFRGHCAWDRVWTHHSACIVASKSLARLLNRLFGFIDLPGLLFSSKLISSKLFRSKLFSGELLSGKLLLMLQLKFRFFLRLNFLTLFLSLLLPSSFQLLLLEPFFFIPEYLFLFLLVKSKTFTFLLLILLLD